MKGKLLLAVGLVAMASSQAFAMNIVKGKLLSHKDWATNGAKAVVQDVKIDPNFLAHALQHKNGFPAFVVVGTTKLVMNLPFSAGGSVINPVGQESKILAASNMTIYNQGSTTKEYVITSDVCSDEDPVPSIQPMPIPIPPKQLKDDPTPISPFRNVCTVSESRVSLDPGGFVEMGQRPAVTITYAKAGMYSVYSSVMAEEEGQSEGSLFGTSDFDYVVVDDAAKAKAK